MRILKWIVVTLLLWSFAFVAGLMPSVVRAVIMCMLVELGTRETSEYIGNSGIFYVIVFSFLFV